MDIHPNIAELYRKKVGKLQTLLNDEATRSQAIDLIRSMIDHIEINQGIERGKPDVILVGALAQILTFTQQNKTAGSTSLLGRVPAYVAESGYFIRCRHVTDRED